MSSELPAQCPPKSCQETFVDEAAGAGNSADSVGRSFSADAIAIKNTAYKHRHCSCRKEMVLHKAGLAGLLV
jgi:hypothetical protein